MVDIFSIILSHSLILLVAWRLMQRDDLDHDELAQARPLRPWLKRGAAPDEPHGSAPDA